MTAIREIVIHALSIQKPPGLILAGGKSSRMGTQKAFLPMRADETILERVIATLSPQVSCLMLNAPADFGMAEAIDAAIPRIPDTIDGQLGPLAGVLAGLNHLAATMPDAGYLLTAPSDSPFLPADLAESLASAITRPERSPLPQASAVSIPSLRSGLSPSPMISPDGSRPTTSGA